MMVVWSGVSMYWMVSVGRFVFLIVLVRMCVMIVLDSSVLLFLCSSTVLSDLR